MSAVELARRALRHAGTPATLQPRKGDGRASVELAGVYKKARVATPEDVVTVESFSIPGDVVVKPGDVFLIRRASGNIRRKASVVLAENELGQTWQLDARQR